MNTDAVPVWKGAEVASVDLAACVHSSAGVKGASDPAVAVAVELAKVEGIETNAQRDVLFNFSNEKREEFAGTFLAREIQTRTERALKAYDDSEVVRDQFAEKVAFLNTLSEAHARSAVVRGDGTTTFVALPASQARPAHSHAPNCEWRITGDRLTLVATEDIPAKQAVTVSYGAVSNGLLRALHCVEGPVNNPADHVEVRFAVPPALTEHLLPYFAEAAALARKEGQLVPGVLANGECVHFLTKENPYPITLRLCSRASLGPDSTEATVDRFLEDMIMGYKEQLFSKETQHEVRAAELDLLIAVVSRLRHTTTLRTGGACHKVLRSPPTLKGETLAGVPLAKCLSVETAAGMQEIAPAYLSGRINETLLRTAQAALMRDGIVNFVPKVAHLPMMWRKTDVSRLLSGTEAEAAVLGRMAEVDAAKEVLRKEVKANIGDASYAWAAALVNKASVTVTIPEEEVRMNVADGKSEPVTYEDEDGDKVSFRVENGKLLYAVNGEDRPPIEELSLLDATTVSFPKIDRRVDLLHPSSPGDAYRLVLSYLRANCARAGVKHDIPATMLFGKPERKVEVIIPAACTLPHGPAGTTGAQYRDQVAWYAASGESLAVDQRPQAGNAELVAFRGEFHTGNPFSFKPVVHKVPCRAVGAEESAEDVHHGLALHAINLISEEQHALHEEVSVAMPDEQLLHAGTPGLSFTVTFKVTVRNPVSKALWFFHLIKSLDTAVVTANRERCQTVEGITAFLAEKGDKAKAAASITADLETLKATFAEGSLESDSAKLAELMEFKRAKIGSGETMYETDGTNEGNQLLSLLLKVEERTIVDTAEKQLAALLA